MDLVGQKERLEGRLAELRRAIDPIWDVLFPEEQRRIAQLLVEEITVGTSGIDIRFRNNGIEQIVEELQPIEERAHAWCNAHRGHRQEAALAGPARIG